MMDITSIKTCQGVNACESVKRIRQIELGTTENTCTAHVIQEHCHERAILQSEGQGFKAQM